MVAKNVSKAQFLAKKQAKGVTRAEALRRWKQRQLMNNQRQPPKQQASLTTPRLRSAQLRPRAFVPQSLRRKLSPGATLVVRSTLGLDATPCRVRAIGGGGPPTALCRIRQVFELTTSTDTTHLGRFAALFRPILGEPIIVPTGSAAIDTYPNYIVVAGSAYPTTSWTTSTNYDTGVNTGSNTTIIDDAYLLAGPISSFCTVTGGGTMNGAQPFGDTPVLGSQRPPSFDPTVTAAGSWSQFVLPIGQWQVMFNITGTGLSGLDKTDSTASVTVFQTDAVGTTRLSAVYTVTVDDEAEFLAIKCTATTVTASTMRIVDAAQNKVGPSGAVQTIRPLGMQVLATYIGPMLEAGGNITAALLPQDAVQNYVLSNGPVAAPGHPFFWENAARMNLPRRVYSGPLRDGAYCYWVPDDVSNRDLQTPTDSSVADLPSIVISGQYTESGGNSGNVNIVRVTVDRMFEFTTASQIFHTAEPYVSYQDYVEAQEFITELPKAFPNDAHDEFFDGLNKWFDDSYSFMHKQVPKWTNLAHTVKSAIGGLMI